MKRRSFLGFLGGAAASGPTLAKGIASDAYFPTPPMGGGWIGGAVKSSEGDWRPSRILELRRLLSGDDGGEAARNRRQNRLSQLEQTERFRLDSLRSISPSHKMSMFIDGNLDRQERVRVGWLENELEHLLTVRVI
jgi:hypothetical protein